MSQIVDTERPEPLSGSGDPPRDLLLDVKDLSVEFDTGHGSLRAVDGISLQIRTGERLSIVGESGSGKSVAARAVMGLLPRTARTTGQIDFAGTELLGLDPNRRRKLLGADVSMVFQDPMTALNPVVRVGRQISEGLRFHGSKDRQAVREATLEMMRRVGIPDAEARLRAYPFEMSGGMRQRICIAAALICGPRLLIADEPTTALDVTIQRQILDVLTDMGRGGMSMLLITHNLGVAASRTDRVAVMYSGRVVETAPTADLFRTPRHPYTVGLMRSMPRLADAPHTRLVAIPGRQVRSAGPTQGCRFADRCASAQPKCLRIEPGLTTDDSSPDHAYACFFPRGTAHGEAALASNRAAGTTAAGLSVPEEEVSS
ncbi:ABC transporter ATP-binding protein [Janibacter anophelis]|uniref:ABC transporter ATP-binding protein n=1 Tax=Janibacter anophelis TaxID=319054 RepID=UPI003F819B12